MSEESLELPSSIEMVRYMLESAEIEYFDGDDHISLDNGIMFHFNKRGDLKDIEVESV